MKRQPVVIALDLGGTNVRMGVVDAVGSVRHSVSRPLGADRSVAGVTGEVARRGAELIDWCAGAGLHPEALCLAAPGIISAEDGTVIFSPNLPGWTDVPLRAMISEALGLPAILENDANAAAFGEFWKGGGQGTNHLVMFTLGTGVGGGIISDGILLRGSRGMAGELGHLTVVSENGRLCRCGSNGCLEAYASASAVAEILGERWTDDSPPPPTAREAYLLAAAGDSLCREVFREAGFYLGVAMADLVNVLNPEVIVIGGGAMDAWDLIIPVAESEMRSRAFRTTDLARRLCVRRATLGDLAGVVGVAGIYWCGVHP
jgi:glucokinase